MSVSIPGVTYDPRTHAFRPQYDPASQLTTLQLGNGGTRKFAYDNRGYMITQVDSGFSGAVSTIVDAYDPGGRKSKQVRDGVTSTYTMDNVGRLTLQNKGGDLSSFAYDNVGHLTLKHNAGESAVTMTRNLLGQVTTYTDGSTLCTNTWDAKGNLTNENIGGVLTTYGWDQENRMTSRARGSGLMNFVYDESHHLRHKEIPGEDGVDNVSFNYLDDIVFSRYEEFFGTRTEQMTPWQGQNLANASTDFLIDPLGSFIGQTSSTGVAELVAFLPYGELQNPGGTRPPSNLWQFVGSLGVYSYSDALKLMWHRWYDANAGSFRSIDPLWPEESAYGYVNGMPQMAVDWEGLGDPCMEIDEDCKGFGHPYDSYPTMAKNACQKLVQCWNKPQCKSDLQKCMKKNGCDDSMLGRMVKHCDGTHCLDIYCCKLGRDCTEGDYASVKKAIYWFQNCGIRLCGILGGETWDTQISIFLHEVSHCEGTPDLNNGDEKCAGQDIQHCVLVVFGNHKL